MNSRSHQNDESYDSCLTRTIAKLKSILYFFVSLSRSDTLFVSLPLAESFRLFRIPRQDVSALRSPFQSQNPQKQYHHRVRNVQLRDRLLPELDFEIRWIENRIEPCSPTTLGSDQVIRFDDVRLEVLYPRVSTDQVV